MAVHSETPRSLTKQYCRAGNHGHERSAKPSTSYGVTGPVRLLTSEGHGGPRSSNASSSADALDRTDANHMDRIDADYPNDGTNSGGFDTDRACLLIRGSRLLGGDEHQGVEASTVVSDLGRARSAGRCPP
jgi:hypothetical protein